MNEIKMKLKNKVSNINDNNNVISFNDKNNPVKKVNESSLESFRVTWKDLTYTVSQKAFGRSDKIILNGVTGCFSSGQITAIMGPSGCGKSSLLSCLSNPTRLGLTGTITITTDIKVKFAFIAQENYILKRLKVRESLLYSSKLKNPSNADHKELVNEVIDKLLIKDCADIWPNRCSGGQLKRILIALELVSKPNILILDEPTSGLDTVTTWQLINTLIELTQQPEPVAVVVTIHQPSARLFNLFNSIYLLSLEGQCIYNGSPQSMLGFLSEYGLICPEFTNPADFALEVASKEHGSAILLTLSTIMKIEAMDVYENEFHINVNHEYNTSRDVYYLTLRSIQTMIRDPFMLPMKFIGYIFAAINISLMLGSDSGILSGCPIDFAIGDGKNLFAKFRNTFDDLFENCACLVFISMNAWFFGIFPVLLIFPLELDVFLKEYGNGYYSCFSYFMSKVLSDIPFNLLLPNFCSIPIYYLTGQYTEQLWRVFNYAFIFLLLSFNSSALGFFIGALLVRYPTAIAFVGLISLVPMILLSGIMVRLETVPTVFRWLSGANYIRYGTVSTLINSYGFDRCDQMTAAVNKTDFLELIPTDKLLELYGSDQINAELLLNTMNSLLAGISTESRSIVLIFYKLTESDYYYSIAMLFLSYFILRALTYLTILRKVESKA